jgi:hypothetical protein
MTLHGPNSMNRSMTEEKRGGEHVDGAVAKGGFLDADAVTREEWVRETSVACGEGGEVFEGQNRTRRTSCSSGCCAVRGGVRNE